ncbi:MAG: hypothetical protein VX438_13950, partial [Planctomycetota bacterium]|nr:hypothetical protein [Planctomycetota bacterium]
MPGSPLIFLRKTLEVFSILVLATGLEKATVLAQAESPQTVQSLTTRSLGVSQQIDQLILPGTPLTHKNMDPTTTPLMVRVIRVFPHGDAYRYDISFSGLTQGNFDLRDFLVREDGSSTEDLPPLPVTINSILGKNQVEPNPLKTGILNQYGGYQKAIWIGGGVWLIVLLLLIWFGRSSKPLTEITISS